MVVGDGCAEQVEGLPLVGRGCGDLLDLVAVDRDRVAGEAARWPSRSRKLRVAAGGEVLGGFGLD
jgi:hypothetical protein